MTLKEDLVTIVGVNNVSDSMFERRLYDHDIAPLPSEISMIFKTIPDVVVKPRSNDEVSDIIKYANVYSVPVVPRGASSWGYGGTIPTNGGIVLELTGLKSIGSIDEENMTVTVGAGLRWNDLLEYLEGRGFTFNVYPSSAPSSTVGGWIATGCLGIGSLKYGHLREHVKELKVATPTGELLSLSRENEPDLFDSFFGSEGTLGVITEATLRIHPKAERVLPQLASFDDIGTMADVISKVVERTSKPFFIEMQDRDYLEIKREMGLSELEAETIALFIYEGTSQQVQEDVSYLKEIVSGAGGSMLPDYEAEEEWEERFYHMRIRKAGPTLLAGEITHPLSELQYVVDETRRIKKKHDLKLGITCFMVSVDTVLYMPMYLADERARWKFMSLLPVINEITAVGLRAGGGPYGFGIWNSFFLKDVYGDEKVREMKERKKRMDPNDVLNPGKMYQVKTKYGIPLYGTAYKIFTSLLGLLKYF
ncbi:putative FAD-linked oxidoreductase [subsurface metagenome]